MRLATKVAMSGLGLLMVAAGIDCTAGGGASKFGTGGSGNGGSGAGTSSGTGATASGTGGGVTLGSSSSSSGFTGTGGMATDPNITHPTCAPGTCTDFPSAPQPVGTSVPANAATLFGAATNFTAGALCVLEPQLSAGTVEGAMIPANWTRPRFRWNAPANLDLFEVRIHTAVEANDLVVWTTTPEYYLDKDIWSGTQADAGLAGGTGLANNAAGTPLTVTIRGVDTTNPGTPIGVSGDFNIAPVIATGSMVFWTVNSAAVTPQSSQLLGFAVGDEGVQQALTLTQIQWSGQIGEDGSVLRGYYDNPKLAGFVDGQVRCTGCHTSTPDGQSVVFTDDWPWAKGAAMVSEGNTGQLPTWLGAGAQAVMKMPWWGTQTMSKAHFKAGDRILVTSYATNFQGAPPAFTPGMSRTMPWEGLPYYDSSNSFLDDKALWHQLAWIDLESTANINVAVTDTPNYGQPLTDRENQAKAAMGTAYGLIATGDSDVSDVSPALSHAGDKIVYVATNFSPDGHPDYTATTADIKIVAYNNHQGGTATALAGASDPAYLEYYPSFSEDDAFIAFTKAPAPSASSPDGPYYNRFGEIDVIPTAGGTATRLVANDPNACAGDNTALGIINSWPKWSPDVVVNGGKTYYFLIFSSARKYGDAFSTQFQLQANPASDFTGLHSSSQLYLAAIVVDNTTQAITTYPAVYLWNQNRTPSMGMAANLQYSNLTPAWDPFVLPPLPSLPPPEMTQ
jgi:hypothetical protein